MEFIKLTTENFNLYAYQIVNLCEQAVNRNENNNKKGQFYTTTLQELYKYVTSGNDLVLMAIDTNNKVIGASYINTKVPQNTYSDLTKYFHTFNEYKNKIINSFSSIKDYQQYITRVYLEKILLFLKISKEVEESRELNPKSMPFKLLIEEQIIKDEFQENNPIREYITTRLYEEYQKRGKINNYINFAYYGIEDIDRTILKNLVAENTSIKRIDDIIANYELFLQAQKPIFISPPQIDIKEYLDANMNNSMEINTYIVLPEYQSSGLAKILLYEALKRSIEKYFSETQNEILYLNTTIHNENISSQRTANLIGMKDYIYIERTKGINRRVYIRKLEIESYREFLYEIEVELLLEYNYYSERFGVDIKDTIRKIEYKVEEYKKKLISIKDERKKTYYLLKIQKLSEIKSSSIFVRRLKK